MNSLTQDLRYAFRSLRKQPGLTLAAVLSLGLGIGANTTVYTWMQSFVIAPLPAVPEFDRLVSVETRGPEDRDWSLSYPSFRDWKQSTTTVDIAAVDMFQAGLQLGGETQRVWGLGVTANYFDVVRVPVALGRGFRDDEETGAIPVTVLGHGFWLDRFSGDSAIIGRPVSLNGVPLTVIGVAAPRFGGTEVGLKFDLYFPVTLEPMLTGRETWLTSRGNQFMDGFGRLREGVTLAQARVELDQVARQAEEAGGSTLNRGAIVKSMGDSRGPGMLRPALTALLGVTGVVLLIACANVANLLIARALSRRREIGIRLALGASRGRLVRQLLTESLVLASLAGGAGLVLTFWGRDLMAAFVPVGPYPINLVMGVNLSVVAFAVLLTFVTAFLFGLVPALQASRPTLVAAVKDEIGSAPGQRSRLQPALVAAQVALSVVSLVLAALFIRSLQVARQVDVGFTEPTRTLLISTDFTLAGYRDSTAGLVLERTLERLRAVPGVAAASAATWAPLGFGGGGSSSADIEGYTPSEDENMSIARGSVSADYFAAMGITIIRGREFGGADRRGSLPVAVVNQAFADRYWPGLDPLGRRLNQGGAWKTVVGVVQTGKYRQLNEAPEPRVYHALAQVATPGSVTFHVRAAGAEARSLSPALRRAVAEVDPNLPYLDVRTMTQQMEPALFVHRIAAWMLSGFGFLALALSALGIYSTTSYVVGRRTREIGLRIALGAGRRQVIGLILRRAVAVVAAGLVIGLGLAFGAGRMLASQLYGVSPGDPAVLGLIALMLGGVALLASWLPALRAARVDPIAALRSE